MRRRGSLSAQYADDWVSGAFVSELSDQFFEVPVLWVHGHAHQSFDYRVHACRRLSFARYVEQKILTMYHAGNRDCAYR